MSTEYGHHAGWVYVSQEGALVAPSSGRIQKEAWSDVREAVTVFTSTAAGTIAPSGITILQNTKSVITHNIGQPMKGNVCTIIIDTSATKNLKFRTGLSATGYDVNFGLNSSACVITCTSDLGKDINTRVYDAFNFKLIAESSYKWHIAGAGPTTRATAKIYTISTTT